MLKARDETGTVHAVSGFRLLTNGGLIEIEQGRIRDAAGLRTFYVTLATTFNIGNEMVSRIGNQDLYLHTRALAASVQGGAPPFTYAWSLTNVTGDPTLTNNTSETTTYRVVENGSEPGSAFSSADVVLTVTDAEGNTATATKQATTGNV